MHVTHCLHSILSRRFRYLVWLAAALYCAFLVFWFLLLNVLPVGIVDGIYPRDDTFFAPTTSWTYSRDESLLDSQLRHRLIEEFQYREGVLTTPFYHVQCIQILPKGQDQSVISFHGTVFKLRIGNATICPLIVAALIAAALIAIRWLCGRFCPPQSGHHKTPVA